MNGNPSNYIDENKQEVEFKIQAMNRFKKQHDLFLSLLHYGIHHIDFSVYCNNHFQRVNFVGFQTNTIGNCL